MMRSCVLLGLLFSAQAVRNPASGVVKPNKEVDVSEHTFLGQKKDVDAAATKIAATADTSPALQPADTYNEDYPVDNSQMTPTQLKYKAQADYANAVARMKEEEGETVAAKNQAAQALAKHHEAVEAAKQAAAARKAAAAAAAKAQAVVDAAKAKVKATGADVQAAETESAEAAAALKKEQEAVVAADKNVDAMEASEAAAEKTLAEKEAEVAELRKQMAAAMGEAKQAQGAINTAANGVDAATRTHQAQAAEHQAAANAVAQQEAAYAKEQADLAAAKKNEEAAKAALKAAEHAVVNGTKTKEQWQAAIGTTKDAYAKAHAKYLKEEEDVVAAKKRVAIAKAALSRHGVVLGSNAGKTASAGLLIPLVLACLFFRM